MQLRWTMLSNTVICFALLLYGAAVYHYVHLAPTHQAKWDALYHETREAYNVVAELRDADEPQFDDKFHEVRTDLDQLEKFENDFSNERWIDRKSSEAASNNMQGCLTALQVYRLHREASSTARLRMIGIVDHCVANGNTGTIFDSK